MSFTDLFNHEEFVTRHIGSDKAEEQAMLAKVGAKDMAEFLSQTVPKSVRLKHEIDLPYSMTEAAALDKLKQHADNIKVNKSYIGLGYYPTRLPNVIVRNILQNPGWYTAYTPYQAEIAQGRLEALLNFQQICIDLSGLDLAGASLLDEATAAAEAMAMARRLSKSKSNLFFVDERIYPQTLDVIKTRAEYFGYEIVVGDFTQAAAQEYFGAIFQYVGKAGDVVDLTEIIAQVKQHDTIVAVAADVMSLVLLKSPAEMGADVALGNTQRFGVPMGFGGPHAAYFAFKDSAKRSAPGRIIGVSVDVKGKTALRMALQTREQHIRREKANSNICTSQVLLANLASMYAVYHGPEGIKRIAKRIHGFAVAFADAIKAVGLSIEHEHFFDTVMVKTGAKTHEIYQAALKAGYNLYQADDEHLSVAFHEESEPEDFEALVKLFTQKSVTLPDKIDSMIPEALRRNTAILTHPVFNSYHTEHEMLRYMKYLEDKDLALNRSMIPLGSCTMKLNATSEMIPITWNEFANVHPFAPSDQVQGYLTMIQEVEAQLAAITGFDAVTVQPNSGASGEYTGMVVIRRYQASKGEGHRNVCLIPRSAHGTNPATAIMAGLQVIVVDTDEAGNVNIEDLRSKAEQHRDNLCAIMITYPSTHGVFEEGIREICDIIHQNGGQVYMDGANMNAQVGLMQPAEVGADVIHMNLHKTFSIPHGGGGPGVGPIAMKSHLAPFMPNNVVSPIAGLAKDLSAVSAAPFGSASILPITWMYITMMGGNGLLSATSAALLHANYIAASLADDYPILYAGQNGRVAHECIIDIRPLKEETGITEVDVAKRLMDYGFHAPTMSFPVAGTLMVEPTESESKEELDRFIAAMKNIKKEAMAVKNGVWPKDNNPLVNAPHTAENLVEEWNHPYSRSEAVYPLPYVKRHKYWPTVNRVDDVYGDRNLICACPSIDNYE